jgi:hypothetical protein
MPRYYFDLVDGKTVPDMSGQVLRDRLLATQIADKLAHDIYRIRPELRGANFWIAVRDEAGDEFHRASVNNADN